MTIPSFPRAVTSQAPGGATSPEPVGSGDFLFIGIDGGGLDDRVDYWYFGEGDLSAVPEFERANVSRYRGGGP